MSDPISTEMLAKLVTTWQHTEPNTKITALLVELLERRRADLTSEEKDALRWLRSAVSYPCLGAECHCSSCLAFAAIDRFLGCAEVKCRHENTSDKYGECTYDAHGFVVCEVEYRECLDCGHWLPLGPSDETPVAVEIRAAEIADKLAEADRLCDWTFGAFGDDEERRGWSIAESNMQDHSDRWHAGYLARVIATHGEDQ